MYTSISSRRIRATVVSLGLLAASSMSCKESPKPDKQIVSVSSSAVASASSSATPDTPPPKKVIPTLVMEPFEATKGMSVNLFAIDGALMVSEGLRVGRIVGESVEWVGSIPDDNVALGGNRVSSVHGFWPDGVDVLYTTNQGRALQPTYFPLTGKGAARVFGEGGGLGWIVGAVKVGETTLAAGYDMIGGFRFETVRGPGLGIKPISKEKAGCKEGELPVFFGSAPPAVSASAVASTGAGTLVVIGELCGRSNAPVAEVWDQPGKSRIIDLAGQVKSLGISPAMLPGKGDELWAASRPILHYRSGKFDVLPELDNPIHNLFVSPRGVLHGISGRTIHRYEDGKWVGVANLSWPMSFNTIAVDEKETYWVSANGVSRLREGRGVDFAEGCKTPFVYLYDVSWKNGATYTYPTTRKALSTFPEIAEVSLVEYFEGVRRLGVKVKTKEQGEAVIAHIKANMKDEYPELFCYVPNKPREIKVTAKKPPPKPAPR